MKRTIFYAVCAFMAISLCGCSGGCDGSSGKNLPESASGVKKAQVVVQVDGHGHTTEQNNILERYKRDNEPGAIKHLYIISAYSGQTLIYSPVKGKVTSSGKRLTPATVVDSRVAQMSYDTYGFEVDINGKRRTNEVLQDDGTYGSSSEYLYWFTPDGRYMQHYTSGGVFVHISDHPLSVKGVIINYSLVDEKK